MGTSSAFASREQREIRNGETKFLGSTTRRFAAIAGLSAVLTLSVTACGGGSDSDDSAVESQTSSDLFGADDAADLPDDLHPNPAGYVRMGERFAPHLDRLIATLADKE